MRSFLCLLFLLLGLLSTVTEAAHHLENDSKSVRVVLQIPRGGAGRGRNNLLQASSSSNSWGETTQKIRDTLENFAEHTYYSKELMPQSVMDAEWAAYLKGWLFVSLPLPLEILFFALVLDSTMMHFSQWDDDIKRKYVLGLYHGVLAFSVILKELSETADSARNVMIGSNLAIHLLLGKIGCFKATKWTMDTITFGTLFYILYNYFDSTTSQTGSTLMMKRWFN